LKAAKEHSTPTRQQQQQQQQAWGTKDTATTHTSMSMGSRRVGFSTNSLPVRGVSNSVGEGMAAAGVGMGRGRRRRKGGPRPPRVVQTSIHIIIIGSISPRLH